MAGSTVLVVDDEPRIVAFLTENLRDDDFSVLSAGTGAEAIDLLGPLPPRRDPARRRAARHERLRHLPHRAPGRRGQRPVGPRPRDHHAEREGGAHRPRPRPRPRRRRLRHQALPLPGAAGPHRRRARPDLARARPSGDPPRRAGREHPLARGDPRRHPARPVGQGVPAADDARGGAGAGVHEEGAARDGVGVPVAGAHAHARLPREPAAPEAARALGRGLDRERVGRRLPPVQATSDPRRAAPATGRRRRAAAGVGRGALDAARARGARPGGVHRQGLARAAHAAHGDQGLRLHTAPRRVRPRQGGQARRDQR